MYDFSCDELNMIRFALEMEIVRRQNNKNSNADRIKEYEELEEKVFQYVDLAETE